MLAQPNRRKLKAYYSPTAQEGDEKLNVLLNEIIPIHICYKLIV